MSEPKRYNVKCGDEGYAIVASLGGEWVRHSDYARLKAVTAEMDKTINISQAGCRELKAEVERLTKADIIVQGSVSVGKSILLYLAEIDRLKAELEAVSQEYRDATNHYNRLHNDLQAEVDRLTAFTTRTIIPNEELQAQVARLTKLLGMCESIDNSIDVWIESKRNAAKEGETK